MTTWSRLKDPVPPALGRARLELHHAAQVVASLGFTHGEPTPDFAHTSLTWNGGGLERTADVGGRGLTVALRPASFDLALTVDGQPRTALSLAGRTLDMAYAWLESAITEMTQTRRVALVRPTHELPAHDVLDGHTFSADPQAVAEIGHWFANADLVLQDLASRLSNPSPVRCWPHHFDIATLETLTTTGESSTSVGAGMTPGDGGYALPYWYVTPWPYPAEPPTSALPGAAHWHTHGWTGAVLEAEATVAGDAGEQRDRVAEFLDVAVGACQGLATGASQ